MFARHLLIPTLAGLLVSLAVGAGRESTPQLGRLKVSVVAATESARASSLAGSLAIVGVDSPQRERLALAEAADGTLEVSLPPGLYRVEWHASGELPLAELSDSSRLVVIAADRVSSVAVHSVSALPEADVGTLAFAGSDAALALR